MTARIQTITGRNTYVALIDASTNKVLQSIETEYPVVAAAKLRAYAKRNGMTVK